MSGEITTTTPARLRAAFAWGLPDVRAHAGKGPGRHPFVARPVAPASPYCDRCGQEPEQFIHQAPKRRSIAAFGKNVTRFLARTQGGSRDVPPS